MQEEENLLKYYDEFNRYVEKIEKVHSIKARGVTFGQALLMGRAPRS